MLRLLCLILLLAPTIQDKKKEEPPGPDPAQVKSAVEALDRAWKSGAAADKAKALQAATEVVHPDVIAAVKRGLKDKDKLVQSAAIEALRWMDHPLALEALHETYKRDAELLKDDDLTVTLLKAIGQHGSESSIDLLADFEFGDTHHPVQRARILSLSGIRSAKSVEALIALMQKVGPAGRGGLGPLGGHVDDLRLSLQALTGVDQGPARDPWIRWWNENKKTLVVSKELPLLPLEREKEYRAFWGLRLNYVRKRREDRGDDPEGGGK